MNFIKFWMKISFIFTTFVNGLYHELLYVDEEILYDSDEIDVIKGTLKEIFFEKRTVTVLWLKDESDELLNAIVNDTSLDSLFLHFDDLRLLEKIQGRHSFNPLIPFSTSEGYLVYENVEALVKRNILKLLYELNPRAQIIFMMETSDNDEILWFLDWSWKEFAFVNTATLNIDEVHDAVTLFAYNPFAKHDKFGIFNLSAANVVKETHRMMTFNEQKMMSLHEYPLKVNLFEQDMSCIKLPNGKYGYQDGEIINLLSEKMNFTPVYIPNEHGVTYGIEEDDGRFSGSLGAIEENKVDIAGNARIITNLYRTRNLLFLRPIGSTKLLYMVPKNYMKKDFTIFPLGFYTFQVVSCYISAFVAFTLVFYLIKGRKILQEAEESKQDLAKIILTMIGIHHSISVLASYATLKMRFLLGTAFLYAVVLSSMYQGNIVKQLNELNEKRDIRTFEQLLSTPLELLIHADLSVHIEYFKDFAPDSIFNQLFKRHRIIPNTVLFPGDFVAYNRTSALLTLDMYGSMLKIMYFDDFNAEERIEVLPIPLKETFLSISVPKTSPFIDQMNYWLSVFDQAGLVSRQLGVAEADLRLEYIRYTKIGKYQGRKPRIFTFNELSSLFLFLLIFHGISCGIFVLEIFWKNRRALCRRIVLHSEL